MSISWSAFQLKYQEVPLQPYDINLRPASMPVFHCYFAEISQCISDAKIQILKITF